MAWEHFPVERGQRLTAAMLNELRDAALERGITVPDPAFSEMGRTTLSNWLASLLSGIKDAAENVYHLPDGYVDEFSDVWRLTAGATNLSATPLPRKNIFELALGDGITDWRHDLISGYRITEEGLNDIYSVLRVFTYIDAPSEWRKPIFPETPKFGFTYGGNSRSRRNWDASTCAAAIRLMYSEPFSDNFYESSIYMSDIAVCLATSVNPFSVSLVEAWQTQGCPTIHSVLRLASDEVYFLCFLCGYRYRTNHPFAPSTRYDLNRLLNHCVRLASSYDESDTYLETVAAGSSVLVTPYPAREDGLGHRIMAMSSGSFADDIFWINHPESDSVTDIGLCDIRTSEYPYVGERTGMRSNGGLIGKDYFYSFGRPSGLTYPNA